MSQGRIVGLHHLQIAMPAGEEAVAEDFYSGVLGFERVPKPPHLEVRGGCWFRAEGVEFHLGVDKDFRAAKKAHPAFVVDDLAAVQGRLEEAGYEIVLDTQIFGYERFYVSDPFGNRLEIMQPVAG